MKPNTRIAIAAALAAAGNLLNALAAELGGSTEAPASPAADTPTPEQPAPPKRGKKATEKAAEPESPAEPEPEKKPAAPAEEELSAEEKEDDYKKLRALIEPLVKDNKGAEVKKIIAKYGATLRDITRKDHAAFEKDLQALEY